MKRVLMRQLGRQDYCSSVALDVYSEGTRLNLCRFAGYRDCDFLVFSEEFQDNSFK
jgi:hypothetical protein